MRGPCPLFPAGVVQPPIDGRADQRRILRDDIERVAAIHVPCTGIGPGFEQRRGRRGMAFQRGPDETNDGCWALEPPIELIILDQFGGFVLITYKEPMSRDLYRGTAYTPTTWLDGSGVRFSN